MTDLVCTETQDADAAIAIGEHAFRAGYTAAVEAARGYHPLILQNYETRMDAAWSDYDPPEDIKALT